MRDTASLDFPARMLDSPKPTVATHKRGPMRVFCYSGIGHWEDYKGLGDHELIKAFLSSVLPLCSVSTRGIKHADVPFAAGYREQKSVMADLQRGTKL